MDPIDQARKLSNMVMIIEADSGGQVLATCPVKYVHADQKTIEILMHDLESLTWGSGKLSEIPPRGSEAFLRFEQLPIGAHIGDGAGSGEVVDGLWLHPELRRGMWQKIGVFQQVERILTMAQRRICLWS